MNEYLAVLKKYAVFSGRARRKEYWMFGVWYVVTIIVLDIVMFMIANAAKSSAPFILVDLYGLAMIIPNLAVSVRRLHDTNHSAWWFLINLIPLIGGIVFIVLAATDSQAGDNKYGPNPKGVAAPAVSQTPVQ